MLNWPRVARFTVNIILFVMPVFMVSCAFVSDDDVKQPIAYNHRVHIENAGLKCQECHLYVETMASATLPSIEICRTCHETAPLSESQEELALLKYVSEEKEIPWVNIYQVPDHVYFSHRRHVVGGELECSACHGMVSAMTAPVTSAFLEVTMENCMDCHRSKNVSNDCLSCHR
ncbi:MAG TPA: cytochrome c3 family protein [Bacteroidota bacterium]|nr:cytochrome c3 family protein [Bacteroidota bacterium]